MQAAFQSRVNQTRTSCTWPTVATPCLYHGIRTPYQHEDNCPKVFSDMSFLALLCSLAALFSNTAAISKSKSRRRYNVLAD